jgi:hypothetical protein
VLAAPVRVRSHSDHAPSFGHHDGIYCMQCVIVHAIMSL